MIYSSLLLNLSNKIFTVTGEIEPLKTGSINEIVQTALTLKGNVTAVNITDNPQAFAYMSGLFPSYFIQIEIGLEAIYQLTCRDRNRLGLVSDLLAASAAGIRNVLALTGDHTSLGDNPSAKPVFDLDSVQLTKMMRSMVDQGIDPNGNTIEKPPMLHVGVAANPNANPIEAEIIKLEKKVGVGAEFVQTQVVYEIERAKEFLKDTSYLNIPTLIGICPLKSVKMAKWFDKECPGISIPPELIERLSVAKEKRGKAGVIEENIEIFGEFLKELKKTTNASGSHIMAVGFEWIIPRILERAGLKGAFDWRSLVERQLTLEPKIRIMERHQIQT
jgi:methylenetetrahydrofolate reductase (NADPH)